RILFQVMDQHVRAAALGPERHLSGPAAQVVSIVRQCDGRLSKANSESSVEEVAKASPPPPPPAKIREEILADGEDDTILVSHSGKGEGELVLIGHAESEPAITVEGHASLYDYFS